MNRICGATTSRAHLARKRPRSLSRFRYPGLLSVQVTPFRVHAVVAGTAGAAQLKG